MRPDRASEEDTGDVEHAVEHAVERDVERDVEHARDATTRDEAGGRERS